LLLKDLLRELRENRGLNKQELANKVDISRSYISTIESGKVEKPTKKTLLKIAYVFDPEGENKVYSQLLQSAGYTTENAEKEFERYVYDINKDFNENINFNPAIISEMKYRVNKKDNNVVFLDKPYMNILWLLEQEEFEIYLGYEDNQLLFDKDNKAYKKPLVLDEEDRLNLLSQVYDFRKQVLSSKKLSEENLTRERIIKENKEYSLIFDLLNNGLQDRREVIERLASIDEEREIFYAEEYYECLEKAIEEKDTKNLHQLIRMTKINELKNYLLKDIK